MVRKKAKLESDLYANLAQHYKNVIIREQRFEDVQIIKGDKSDEFEMRLIPNDKTARDSMLHNIYGLLSDLYAYEFTVRTHLKENPLDVRAIYLYLKIRLYQRRAKQQLAFVGTKHPDLEDEMSIYDIS